MTVEVKKNGHVWTVIHNRPEARNAMDPQSADALTRAFLEFDADKTARVAVLYGEGGAFCAGWDLKYVSTLNADYPLGELDIPPAGPRGNLWWMEKPKSNAQLKPLALPFEQFFLQFLIDAHQFRCAQPDLLISANKLKLGRGI